MATTSPKDKKSVGHTKKPTSDRKAIGDKARIQRLEDGKRLIPYSLYLPEHTYLQLKIKAKSRQASSMVRDAITMILEGNDQFTAGYRQAGKDILRIIDANKTMRSIAYDGFSMAEIISDEVNELARFK